MFLVSNQQPMLTILTKQKGKSKKTGLPLIKAISIYRDTSWFACYEELTIEQNHERAALAMVSDLKWSCELIAVAKLYDNSYVSIFNNKETN